MWKPGADAKVILCDMLAGGFSMQTASLLEAVRIIETPPGLYKRSAVDKTVENPSEP
jgi:hypothetical protein